MGRINRAMLDDYAKWKRLMNNDIDCAFCKRLHANDAEAVMEAEAYTNENFPDLNDDPPIL